MAKIDRDAAQDDQARTRAKKLAASARAEQDNPSQQAAPEGKKRKVTIYLTEDLISRLKGAVHHCQFNAVGPQSNSDLFEQAVSEKLDRLAHEYGLQDFPRARMGDRLIPGPAPKD